LVAEFSFFVCLQSQYYARKKVKQIIAYDIDGVVVRAGVVVVVFVVVVVVVVVEVVVVGVRGHRLVALLSSSVQSRLCKHTKSTTPPIELFSKKLRWRHKFVVNRCTTRKLDRDCLLVSLHMHCNYRPVCMTSPSLV
jgi:hypothetical protein